MDLLATSTDRKWGGEFGIEINRFTNYNILAKYISTQIGYSGNFRIM